MELMGWSKLNAYPNMTTTLTPGDKVRIISNPIVENNESGQASINSTVGMDGEVMRTFKNGIRNILVWIPGHSINYYSVENLRKI